MRSGTRGGISLGRLWGIPLSIDYSWFIILLLVTFTLRNEIQFYYPRGTQAAWWGLGLLTALLFFSSVLAHELAHSLLARRRGIPVKGITLFVFGGVSRIGREANTPSADAAIAIVGPITSVALSGAFFLLALAFGGRSEPLHAILIWLLWVNLALAAFNMLPGLPLDGGRIFRAAIWSLSGDRLKATSIAGRTGQALALLMMGGGITLAIALSDSGGLWIAIVGLFLLQAASATRRQASLLSSLARKTAGELASRAFLSVRREDRLADVRSRAGRETVALVMSEMGLEGLVTVRQRRRMPLGETAGSVMLPRNQTPTVQARDTASLALELLEESDLPALLVLDGSEVVGIIGPREFLAASKGR